MVRIAPQSKLFNRRRYLFYEGYKTRREAEAVAKRQRKLGFRVRIVTFPQWQGFFLYQRGLRTKGLVGYP